MVAIDLLAAVAVMLVVWLAAIAFILGVLHLGKVVDERWATVRRRRQAHQRARHRRRQNPQR